MRPGALPWLGPVEVTTLLRTPEGTFVPVADGPPPWNWTYVEGAIQLSLAGRPILDTRLWDDVNWLWEFIGNMVETIGEGWPRAETMFPDQPIRFAIEWQRRRQMVEVVCEADGWRRSGVAHDHTFFETLCRAALVFADELDQLGTPEPLRRRPFEDCLARLPDWPTKIQGCTWTQDDRQRFLEEKRR